MWTTNCSFVRTQVTSMISPSYRKQFLQKSLRKCSKLKTLECWTISLLWISGIVSVVYRAIINKFGSLLSLMICHHIMWPFLYCSWTNSPKKRDGNSIMKLNLKSVWLNTVFSKVKFWTFLMSQLSLSNWRENIPNSKRTLLISWKKRTKQSILKSSRTICSALK